MEPWMWFLSGVLWTVVFVLIGLVYLAKWLEKPVELLPCACGCGRRFSRGDAWDGLHGPDYSSPKETKP